MNRTHGWRPTPIQETLLQACLQEQPEAEAALQRWLEQRGQDDLDQGCQRLLPLLWHRHPNAITDAQRYNEAKGRFLRTWRDNRILLARCHGVLQSLTNASIPVMLIKGLALSCEAYRSLGVRPMADLDVAVPFPLVSQALERLEREGWRASPTPLGGSGSAMASDLPWLAQGRAADHFDLAYLITRHGHGFRADHGQEIDVHWFLFQGQCDPGIDEDLWHRAQPLSDPQRWGLEGFGDRLLLPSAADHLLLLLCHGARWNPVPSIRWVADAVTLVRSAPDLDWDRFLGETGRRRATLPVREMLLYLHDTFQLQLPGWVIARLEAAPVSRAERQGYERAIAPASARSALAEWRYLRGRHRRLRKLQAADSPVPNFARYVCHVLGAPGTRALAAYGRRELLRRWSAAKVKG